MSCIVPEHIDDLLDKNLFEAKMQQYGITEADLVTLKPNHPFLTQYLQPLLQRIADSVADMSSRTEDWQKSRLTVTLYDGAKKNLYSTHDHKTNEIVIALDVTKGTLQEKCKSLLNDTRHESEHANQTDGDGYSIDQRTLVRLSRLVYHPGNNDLYYNNFNEIRARLSEYKMRQEIYDRLVQQKAPFEQRQIAAQHLASAESHLTHHLSEQVQEDWIKRAQAEVQKKWPFQSKAFIEGLRKAFPEAQNIQEARDMAMTFLDQKAPDLFKELRDEIKAYSKTVTECMVKIDDERREVAKQEAQKEVLAHENAQKMPILDKMPQPTPMFRFRFTDASQVETIMSGSTITLYNRALVQMDGDLYLIGDTTDQVRDYINKWPAEVQEQLAKNRVSTTEEMSQVDIDTDALFAESKAANITVTPTTPTQYGMTGSINIDALMDGTGEVDDHIIQDDDERFE
ncbi:MAG: hypothetical protein IJZ68_05980 [Bacteroidaceae bacterium]|nr:hypothetical protein [Bacteroidaceae bacterium]